MATLATFNWKDPLLLDQQFDTDEHLLRDSARCFVEAFLALRVLEALRHERTDRRSSMS